MNSTARNHGTPDQIEMKNNSEDKFRLPDSNSSAIEFETDESICSITLPADYSKSFIHKPRKNGKGETLYRDKTSTFSNNVRNTELGLEILTVLNSDEASNEYQFEINNTNGLRLKATGDDNEAILVYNNNGAVIAVIENLIAKDAKGNEIGTALSINGNITTQRISTGNNGVTYPITSGINVYSTGSAEDLLDWFDDAHWVWRDDRVSLRLYAKNWCLNANITTALKEAMEADSIKAESAPSCPAQNA